MTTATTPGAGAPSKGSAAAPRCHSLIDLELERDPSLDQLLRERDGLNHAGDAIIEMAVNRVRVLVAERNGRA